MNLVHIFWNMMIHHGEMFRFPMTGPLKKDFDPVEGEACTAFLTGGFGWYRKKIQNNGRDERPERLYCF